MELNKESQVGVFKIAATYIGTVVGAGFASGQEVLQFFTTYGYLGLFGVLISSFLFFFFGYSILVLGRNLNADSHDDIVLYTNGKILGTIIDIIITLFLFGALSAMIAGSGAIFNEQFGISPLIGGIFMGIITLYTVFKGTKGVINAISYVVPVLLISVFLICMYSILMNPLTESEMEFARNLEGATPNWLISAFNYASYNLVIAIAVLGPLGAKSKNKKSLFSGALLGALGLGIGVIAIYYSLLTNIETVYKVEVPMVEIGAYISKWIKFIFSIVLIAEIYTTAVGNLFGFINRLAFIGKKYEKLTMILSTIAAFLIAQVGFSSMVRYLYPAVGYGGLLLFGGIIYVWITRRSIMRK